MNYSNIVFAQIPIGYKKIQNIAAGYVLSRYANLHDVIELKWLPVKEYFELNTSETVHKSRRDVNHPDYLKVQFCDQSKGLRSTDKESLIKVVNDGTFQCQARCYDNLPENIKSLETLDEFTTARSKKFLF